MEIAKEFRRLGVVARKRLAYFKYNIELKMKHGFYNPIYEE